MGTKEKPKVKRGNLWVSVELIRRLSVIASYRDITISELVEDWIEKKANTEYQKVADQMLHELGEAGA
jgi:hypothetical protein